MKKLFLLVLLTLVTLSCYSNDADKNDAGQEQEERAHEDFSPDLQYAQVVEVKTTRDRAGTWRFDVTVRHDDEGWEHYADLWQVVDPDTLEVYGERVLAHPHDTEQPFTRSQSGIEIPEGVAAVLIRAKCNNHDFLRQNGVS